MSATQRSNSVEPVITRIWLANDQQEREMHETDWDAALWKNHPVTAFTVPNFVSDLRSGETFTESIAVDWRADIDVSGPEFDFIRSVRVFDVGIAQQREESATGECNRKSMVRLGEYDRQGGFSWRESDIRRLPVAHFGLEHWMRGCSTIDHRSVFVEWRDYTGGYGFEQINY